MRLDQAQQQVVDHDNGSLMVLAVAGSGKTTAIVHRLARLVDTADPSSILAVTFSKKAAGEMQIRLTDLIGKSACRVSTIHSLAYEICRSSIPEVAEREIDEYGDRYQRIVSQAMREIRSPPELSRKAPKVAAQISFFKNTGRWPDPYWAKELPAIAQRASAIATEQGVFTYDDMLVGALLLLGKPIPSTQKLLPSFAVTKDQYANDWIGKYTYVLQDEAQDCNPTQDMILRALMPPGKGSNYMIVGDPEQTIYSFRGSDPTIFTRFEKDYKPCIIKMYTNYRSHSQVVEAAERIGEKRTTSTPRGDSGSVEVIRHQTVAHEAIWLAEQLKEIENPDQVAILYRTNAQSGVLEAVFSKLNIPFRILGPSLFSLREVAGVVGYLWLAGGRATRNDVRRSMNAPFRFLKGEIGDIVWDEHERDVEQTWERAVLNAESLNERERSALTQWAKLVDDLAVLSENEISPLALIDTIVTRTELIARLQNDATFEHDPVENVMALKDRAGEFVDLHDFLDEVDAVVTGAKNKDRNEPAVTLCTAHRSKSLEWDQVFVIGCIENLFPISVDEERRILYVAATRARDSLIFSWVKEWRGKETIRARLLGC